MKLNLDEDWQDLGHDSPLKRATKDFFQQAPSMIMGLLNRLFAWIEFVLFAPFRAVRDVLVWFVTGNHFWQVFGAVLATTLFGVTLYVVLQTFRSNGRITYCSIEYAPNNYYVLHAHRDWRPDLAVRYSPDFNLLLTTAQSIECPLQLRESPHGLVRLRHIEAGAISPRVARSNDRQPCGLAVCRVLRQRNRCCNGCCRSYLARLRGPRG